MDAVIRIWLEFAACVAVIGVAGSRLVRYGDALASLTGLSRNWIGMILMATVTSLPELVTGLSAVTIAAAPDIAVGDALGSCVFNLALLVVVELMNRDSSLFAQASRIHILSAGAGIVLLGVAALGIQAMDFGSRWSVGHVSGFSIVLLVLYGIAMRTIYNAEQRGAHVAELEPMSMTLMRALGGYAISALFIVVAGIWLPLVGVQLARLLGWSDSFVGTLFIALATSMPELVTTLAALRLGAVDLALGNILGSNLFDLLIIALDDLAYIAGPIFRDTAAIHVVSALVACLMSGVFILALTHPPKRRFLFRLSWAGGALLALFLLNVLVQYSYRP